MIKNGDGSCVAIGVVSGRLLEAPMLEALSQWLALALSLTPLVIFTCNKTSDKGDSVRERGGADNINRSRRQVAELNVDATQAEEELPICDSLRDVRIHKAAKPVPSTTSGKRCESDSSYTDLIVVPLGKAKTAMNRRNNLTRKCDRKRDRSSMSEHKSQKKVKFREVKSSKRKSVRDYREEPTEKSSSLT
ncbi:hypothetical protein GCK32_009064 [Trichostrongylus colubriformis]|uniref:Uncharacterized protein n=1 Tax=Trichostrongylus colubriformis TaxID=6319 RepID=A0AAN8IEY2_TRICO